MAVRSPPLMFGLLRCSEHAGPVQQHLFQRQDWPAMGNYGEVFERNVGQGSPLKLERGVNQQWLKGGLMYSPPFL